MATVGAMLALTAGLLAFAQYQSPEARWHRQHEAQTAERRAEPAKTDWRPIHGQLVQYSRRSFPVIFGQTGQWGGANPSGHILLDLTTLRDPKDILAFKLAHEWAHLVLGHGSPHHSAAATTTAIEDEADQWAGAFLAQYNYDLQAVATYLKNLPYDPTDTTHSPGDKRAELVLEAAQP